MERSHLIQKAVVVSIIFLFSGTCAFPSLAHESTNPSISGLKGTWLYVGGSGPGNYTSIQDAINASSENDTVFVYDDSSPYHENIIVDKPIYLLGEGKNTTIIDGITEGPVISVLSNRVEIGEFTIQNYYPSPCLFIRANQSLIYQNIIGPSSGIGIYLISSNDVGIIGNTISDNAVGGLRIEVSNDNIISGNDIINNGEGLDTILSAHNSIYYNNFINNLFNAIDEGNNSWNNEYPSAGNYWNTYAGSDLYWGPSQDVSGADGVGDTPQCIPGGMNQDHYPLMEPYAMTQLAFSFSGGLGIGGKIRNVGNATAFKVGWKVTLTGGLILLGKETLREIPKPLIPGEEATVKSNMVLGFGKTTFTIILWADNAPFVSRNCSATVILFFVVGIH
jgi:parallel beta-helix repeat protein